MKTFKLVSFAFIEESSIRQVPLIDGLIINREYGGDNWLIEAYVPKSYLADFEKLVNNEEMVPLQVIISKTTNDPATFHAKVKNISVMDEHISVLLDASLYRRNNSFHVDLLTQLVHEGLSGENLVDQFVTRSKGNAPASQAQSSK